MLSQTKRIVCRRTSSELAPKREKKKTLNSTPHECPNNNGMRTLPCPQNKVACNIHFRTSSLASSIEGSSRKGNIIPYPPSISLFFFFFAPPISLSFKVQQVTFFCLFKSVVLKLFRHSPKLLRKHVQGELWRKEDEAVKSSEKKRRKKNDKNIKWLVAFHRLREEDGGFSYEFNSVFLFGFYLLF